MAADEQDQENNNLLIGIRPNTVSQDDPDQLFQIIDVLGRG